MNRAQKNYLISGLSMVTFTCGFVSVLGYLFGEADIAFYIIGICYMLSTAYFLATKIEKGK